ncbi:unnamed protein product [Vitrella brassicaformis CCMP3155]|uniref:RNase III domain-containing protein n=2 Tax=Vitrella brassicaformis TaxID=1169539 RepID=A0A0G4H4B1_VITBC|nr:unnamed protein product [Vitrella brassicaformis CCMP3155]|eukprot:CEM38602.1 unnamed protein product [Vitrella brassicaformis CCMP3155]
MSVFPRFPTVTHRICHLRWVLALHLCRLAWSVSHPAAQWLSAFMPLQRTGRSGSVDGLIMRRPLTRAARRPRRFLMARLKSYEPKTEADVFEIVGHALKIHPDNLRSEIADVRGIYPLTLKDDDKNRAILGDRLLDIALSRYMKAMYTGLPPEVHDRCRVLLLRNSVLGELREFAVRQGGGGAGGGDEVGDEEWEAMDMKERANLVEVAVAMNPQLADDVIKAAIRQAGYESEADLLLALASSWTLKGRGGGRWAGRFRNAWEEAKKAAMDEEARLAGLPLPSEQPKRQVDHGLVYNRVIEWLRRECGLLQPKIKEEVYTNLLGRRTLLHPNITAALVPKYVSADEWLVDREEQLFAPEDGKRKNALIKSAEAEVICCTRRKILARLPLVQTDATEGAGGDHRDDETGPQVDESVLWEVVGELLRVCGFSPRECLAAAIRRVQADEFEKLELRHFRWKDFGL